MCIQHFRLTKLYLVFILVQYKLVSVLHASYFQNKKLSPCGMCLPQNSVLDCYKREETKRVNKQACEWASEWVWECQYKWQREWVSEWVSERASKWVGVSKNGSTWGRRRDGGTVSMSMWGMTRRNKQQSEHAQMDEHVDVCVSEHKA
jgi:hypothetical protein